MAVDHGAIEVLQRDFAGLSSSALMVVVHSQQLTTSDNGFRQTVSRVERILRANSHVRSVVPPHAGSSISADRHTAVVIAGAGDPVAQAVAQHPENLELLIVVQTTGQMPVRIYKTRR